MEKVLIIDDEPGFCITVKRMLEKNGYECLTAHSGREGIALAPQFHPNIVLCDVFMPEMNGYETLQVFRESDDLAIIPFMFMTADSDPMAHRFGMDLGADDYMSKPIKQDLLISAIKARLTKQRILVLQVERMLRKMRIHLDEIKQLSEVTARINAGLLLEDICEQIYQNFKMIIPYNRIGLSLIEENGTVVCARWAKSEAADVKITGGYTQPLHGSSLEQIIKTGKPRIINDLEQYFKEHPQSVSTKDILAEGVRSSLTCPLKAMGKHIGFLFFSSFTGQTYKDEHTELYLQIAGQLAIVIEKARLYQEVIELNNLKNKFLGIAAHDLRNPLATVINFSAILLEDDTLKEMPEQFEMMQFIHGAGETALQLINDLLDISSIESGLVPLKKRMVELRPFFEKTIQVNQLLANRKNITIDLKADAGSFPESISADANRLKQVMDNYLSNAIKYSHKNTRVTVCLSTQGKQLRVEICDEGQGIPQTELKNLFKEYSRTSVLPTAGEKSTGLGLAIVKKIVKVHGGEVGVASQVGKGSCFYFTLPIE